MIYQSTLFTSSDLSPFLNGKPSHSWCIAKKKKEKKTQAKRKAPFLLFYTSQNALAYLFVTTPIFWLTKSKICIELTNYLAGFNLAVHLDNTNKIHCPQWCLSCILGANS